MAIRLKTKFRKKGPKTLEDRASVVATNIWRIAQETARHMEKEGYPMGGDRQVVAVITEMIAFLIQIADRLVYGQLSEEERGRFINALGQHTVRITSTNLAEFIGEGSYAGEIVNTLNARLADYAEMEFNGRDPSYSVLRYLGEKVSDAMEQTDSKWVLEQVVDIEAIEAIKLFKKAVGEILGVKVS
ncbi:MAG: hypothetical protein NUV55_01420 [Sulfuricaulis sp.]|uniref:hypothetical protein n=1 Tax=Sulfuricaulis sp. TaxID=2003553 RepID=UPI0025EECFD7|nr:hypothetical protein [Sulfuricaulis sp.]MCR4345855.1 hypothetical protein [Sulfuricaulis sp.]